jgi:hypothetical protein
VLLNAGLKGTINHCLENDETLLLNGGLRKTTNHCLVEVISLLLSGGLRKTTNQSGGFESHSLVMLTYYNSIDRNLKLES